MKHGSKANGLFVAQRVPQGLDLGVEDHIVEAIARLHFERPLFHFQYIKIQLLATVVMSARIQNACFFGTQHLVSRYF